MPVAQSLTDRLCRLRRKLLWTRVVESASVSAIAGGLAAAVLTVAWTVVPLSRPAAAAVCLASVLGAGVWLAATRKRRRHPDRLAPAGVAAVAGLAALALIAGGVALPPRWMLGVILIPLAALAGAAGRGLRGVSLTEAARFADWRFALDERATTAWELIESDRGETPAGRLVIAQAADALDAAEPTRGFWRRTRATPAGLALVAIVCAVGTLLPLPSRRADVDLKPLTAELTGAAPDRRRELIAKLNAAAEAPAIDEQLAEALRAAVEAARDADAEKLRDALTDAEGAMANQTEIPQALAELLEAAAEAQRRQRRLADAAGDEPVETRSAPKLAGPAWARVWNPQYVGAVGEQPPADEPDRLGPDGAMVDHDLAWAAARERAERALAAGEVPSRYRELVREYFRPGAPSRGD